MKTHNLVIPQFLPQRRDTKRKVRAISLISSLLFPRLERETQISNQWHSNSWIGIMNHMQALRSSHQVRVAGLNRVRVMWHHSSCHRSMQGPQYQTQDPLCQRNRISLTACHPTMTPVKTGEGWSKKVSLVPLISQKPQKCRADLLRHPVVNGEISPILAKVRHFQKVKKRIKHSRTHIVERRTRSQRLLIQNLPSLSSSSRSLLAKSQAPPSSLSNQNRTQLSRTSLRAANTTVVST